MVFNGLSNKLVNLSEYTVANIPQWQKFKDNILISNDLFYLVSQVQLNLFHLSVRYKCLYFYDMLLKHFNSPTYTLKKQLFLLGTCSVPRNALLSIGCDLKDTT